MSSRLCCLSHTMLPKPRGMGSSPRGGSRVMERPLRPAGRLPRPARRPLVRVRATHQGPYRAREGTTGGRSRRVAYAITRVKRTVSTFFIKSCADSLSLFLSRVPGRQLPSLRLPRGSSMRSEWVCPKPRLDFDPPGARQGAGRDTCHTGPRACFLLFGSMGASCAPFPIMAQPPFIG